VRARAHTHTHTSIYVYMYQVPSRLVHYLLSLQYTCTRVYSNHLNASLANSKTLKKIKKFLSDDPYTHPLHGMLHCSLLVKVDPYMHTRTHTLIGRYTYVCGHAPSPWHASLQPLGQRWSIHAHTHTHTNRYTYVCGHAPSPWHPSLQPLGQR
jgi:hypothetical protein